MYESYRIYKNVTQNVAFGMKLKWEKIHHIGILILQHKSLCFHFYYGSKLDLRPAAAYKTYRTLCVRSTLWWTRIGRHIICVARALRKIYITLLYDLRKE